MYCLKFESHYESLHSGIRKMILKELGIQIPIQLKKKTLIDLGTTYF